MLAGGFLLVALIAYFGFEAVAEDMRQIGWGLVAIALFHLVPMLLSALGWQAVHRGPGNGSILVYLQARWVREAVNGLLPVGQVGGQFVGARILTNHGAKAPVAVAGSIVDLSMEVITQFFFGLLGLVLLVAAHGLDRTVFWLIVGLCLAALLLSGFLLAQRWGLFELVERGLTVMSAVTGLAAVAGMAGLHDALAALNRKRGNLAFSMFWHSLSWLIGAGEIWLTLYLLGHHVTIAEALILESLGQAVRSAAFIMPGALGVQEGGYIVLGGLLGFSPDISLSLSLAKRVRELLLGLPALLTWQIGEGRFLLRKPETPPLAGTSHPKAD